MANHNSYIKMMLDGNYFDFDMNATEEEIVLMFFNLLSNHPYMLGPISSACKSYIIKSMDDESKASLN